ncbi:MAG: response regulator [Ruminiclostridium sp.]|nr:response regulator [Ruminiclostridium sp.]
MRNNKYYAHNTERKKRDISVIWIINNCALLIFGTVAGITGVSFYMRNKASAGNIRYYMLFYGVFSALWCFSYAVLGVSTNLSVCAGIRIVGLIAIDAFLMNETLLVTEMAGLRKKTALLVRITVCVLSVIDVLLYSNKDVDIFVREDGYTRWYANTDMKFNRNVHSIYEILMFVLLFVLALIWLKRTKLKRSRRFLAILIVANFSILFFTIPDTLFPAIGLPGIATSGIGGAVCTIVMWYGAIVINSFDVSVGNITNRLFDFIEAGVIVFDTSRHIAIMNAYAENRLSGGKNSEISDLFSISETDIDVMFDKGANEIYSTRLWDKKGEKAYSVKLNSVKDTYGEPYCILMVFADITEEIELADKFSVASHAKSQFLAQMSHEIRTPINAVLGMNEMILRESKDDDILEYATNIDSAGNTLLNLINSILDFSKIEDGKMELVPVKYDTASLLNDLYHSIIQRADSKGLAFVMNADETLPCSLYGDDIRVSQIIMNLLTNAVKYTEKGTVTLTVSAEEMSEKTVKLRVSVKDTGIGIKAEDLGRLFESFERLDEIRNRNIEGTGLGISIVTSLLKMMGSSLQVKSKYGEGSEFYFVLEQGISDPTPIGNLQERMKKRSERKDSSDVISAPNARVLLVDDNDMNLKVAKNLLKLCGIKPDMASSGEEAIGYMRHGTYDIVFLDHMMPKMDGIETLRKLKSEGLVPDNTTMIALTANAVVGAREMYLKEGFKDYLSKPMEVKQLVEKLEKYLPESAYKASEADDSAAGEKSVSMPDTHDDDTDVLEFYPDNGAENSVENVTTAYDAEKLTKAGINVSVGLGYSGGDEEFYGEMLDDFATSFDGKISALDGFLAEENWQDYNIKVHAMKSNARMIGAESLSSQALKLEEASGNEDTGYVKENHSIFAESGRKIVKAITESRR